MPRSGVSLEGVIMTCLMASCMAFVPPAGPARAISAVTARRPVPVVMQSTSSTDKGPVLGDDEELAEGYTEVDGIIFEGDFEDDSVKPSLTSLLEDVSDDSADTFKLDGDDSFFSIPDYVPSELPDLAAIGSGLESKRDMANEFLEGDLDVNDQKMFKLLGLDSLDEKKTKVDPNSFKLPVGYALQEAKNEIRAKYRGHENDTGSSAVQVATLTLKVQHLTNHVRNNPKDYSSRRGLLQAVNQRRRLLNYMSKANRAATEKLVSELGVRYRTPDTYRSKFDKYRFFPNTKSKYAKNMQLTNAPVAPAQETLAE